jgi:hypothetical protein
MNPSHKACPFVSRECLEEGCLAWKDDSCRLIPRAAEITSPFEMKLRSSAPLMYRSLLDLVKIMEETSRDCGKCGPELWNYAQEARASLLNDLTYAELAEAGIKANKEDR